jgi:hypothetical protein
MNRDGTSSIASRPLAAHLWKFINQKEPGIPNFKLRMEKRFAVSPWHATDLFGSKGLLIKLNRLTGAFDYQVRCNRMLSLGNWLDLMGHCFSFLLSALGWNGGSD